MSPKSLSGFYSWTVKILIIFIPFLSLLITSSMYFPYITGRNFTFRILAEVALAFWLGLIILSKEYRPRLTPITWALLIFIGIVGLADLLGVNFYKSFWSNFERMEGYLGLLHLFAYFIILTTIFKKRDWFIFFNLFVVAGLFVGFYGLSQKFGWFGVGESIQGGLRIDGTIGNPTYLAAYLTLILILAALLFFQAKSGWGKTFYAASGVYLLWIIYLTATRGAILSLVIGVPIFLLLYLVFVKGENKQEKVVKRILGAALILIVLTPIVIWLLRDSPLVKNNYILSRLAFATDLKTVGSRVLIWKMTLQASKERPILGWGQENYLQAFSKYYDPRLFDQEPWFDRAHNIMLDWLINAGLLGLLSYLSLFGAVFYVLWRSVQNGRLAIKEGLVIAVGLIVYFIQNLFVFDNFNTYVIFFAILAYVNSYDQSSVSQNSVYQPYNEKLIRLSLIVFVVSLIISIFLIYLINSRPISQALGIINAFKASATQSADPIGETLKNFQSALNKNSFGNAEVVEQFLKMATNLVNLDQVPEAQRLGFAVEAANAGESYLKKFPQDIRMHLSIGVLYDKLAVVTQKAEILERGAKHALTAIDLSPQKQDTYSLLAENYLYAGRYDEAVAVLQKAAAIFPNNSITQGNLAIMAILTEREGEIVGDVLKELKRIMTEDTGDREQAIGVYRDNVTRILQIYKRIGNSQKANLLEKLLAEAAI